MTGNYATGSSTASVQTTIVKTTSTEVPDIVTTVGLTTQSTAREPTTTTTTTPTPTETTTASLTKTTATPTTTIVPLTTTTVSPAITAVVTGTSTKRRHQDGCTMKKINDFFRIYPCTCAAYNYCMYCLQCFYYVCAVWPDCKDAFSVCD